MKIFITGSAGFIGFHLAKTLLDNGERVVGLDNLNDYYSRQLKLDRNKNLNKHDEYSFYHIDLCDYEDLEEIFQKHDFDVICHLAAQAGVRYSIERPFIYQKSNLEGFTNILEMVRQYGKTKKLIFASSSSVYGGNKKVPYSVGDDVTTPVSYYGATKVANEIMAYSYHHLYGIPMAGLRFFTVYGPWGRPDMSYFKFTEKILKGDPIDVFNYGDMKRDFTYIDDIIDGIVRCLNVSFDYEIFNLGNNRPVNLLDFIEILEEIIGKKAKKNTLPMQSGDMYETFADISKSKKMLGFEPKTDIKEGLNKFFNWYSNYFKENDIY